MVPFGFVGDKFPDVKLVTVLTDLNDSKFIARKDRLTSLQDLGGKKIGYSKSTVSDIHIKRLLAKYNIDSDSVQLINLSPAALPTAFAQGDIDAYASWEPNVANGAKLFSGNIIFTDTGDKYERYYSIFTDQTYAKQHPEIIAGILKAFAQANTYITEHQQESQELIATFLGLDKSLIAALWSDYHFDIGIKDTHTSALTDIFDRASKQQTDPSSTQSTIKDLILTP